MKNKILVELVAKQFTSLVSSKDSRTAIVALGKWVESSPQITEEELDYLLNLVSLK